MMNSARDVVPVPDIYNISPLLTEPTAVMLAQKRWLFEKVDANRCLEPFAPRIYRHMARMLKAIFAIGSRRYVASWKNP